MATIDLLGMPSQTHWHQRCCKLYFINMCTHYYTTWLTHLRTTQTFAHDCKNTLKRSSLWYVWRRTHKIQHLFYMSKNAFYFVCSVHALNTSMLLCAMFTSTPLLTLLRVVRAFVVWRNTWLSFPSQVWCQEQVAHGEGSVDWSIGTRHSCLDSGDQSSPFREYWVICIPVFSGQLG